MEQLMEGVTVLAQYEKGDQYGIEILIFMIIVGSSLFLGGFAAVQFETKFDSIFKFLLSMGVIGLCTLLAGIVLLSTREKPYTAYDVTIDDDVNFIEFYEKYEVIDQNGKIYTIREKEK